MKIKYLMPMHNAKVGEVKEVPPPVANILVLKKVAELWEPELPPELPPEKTKKPKKGK